MISHSPSPPGPVYNDWRCWGLNPGPRTCEARALPLSYIPYRCNALGNTIDWFSRYVGFRENEKYTHIFSQLSKTFPLQYWQFSFPLLDGGEVCRITDDVISLKVKSPRSACVSCRVQWRVPVIQATGRLRLADHLSSGVLSCSGLCRSGVRTKFGIDMELLGEPGTTRSPKEG